MSDETVCRVIGRNAHGHSIADENPYFEFFHAPRKTRRNHLPGVEAHVEIPAGDVRHLSLCGNEILSCHIREVARAQGAQKRQWDAVPEFRGKCLWHANWIVRPHPRHQTKEDL